MNRGKQSLQLVCCCCCCCCVIAAAAAAAAAHAAHALAILGVAYRGLSSSILEWFVKGDSLNYVLPLRMDYCQWSDVRTV